MAKRPRALDASAATVHVVELSDEDSPLDDGRTFPSWSRVVFRWPDIPDSPSAVLLLGVAARQVIVTSFGFVSADPSVGFDLALVHSVAPTKLRDQGISATWAMRTAGEWDRAVAESRILSDDEKQEHFRSRRTALNTARRRRVITDDLLQRVADTYNSDTSGKPQEAVAETEFTSHRNAGRLISLARERGYISPVQRRSPKRRKG